MKSIADYYTTGDVNQISPFRELFLLNEDLTFNTGFSYTPQDPNSNTQVLLNSASGKTYISSYISPNTALRRINSDGSPDNTFTPVVSSFNDIKELADGTLVGLTFTNGSGVCEKISSAGTIDNTFNVQSVGEMTTINVQPDGKYVISIVALNTADGLSVNGTTVKELFRLNTDGTVDNTYAPDSYVFQNHKTSVLPDNSIFFAGSIKKPSLEYYPFDHFDATGKAVFPAISSLQGFAGYDFVVDGSFIYLLTQKTDLSFELIRLLTSGTIDDTFVPVVYNSYKYQSDQFDRIHLLQDGSFLILSATSVYRVVIPPAPTAPTNLVAMTTNKLQIDLTWTDNSVGESSFVIERAVGSGAFLKIGTVAANITAFSDTNVASQTDYSYRVKAVNLSGESAYSNVANITSITGIEPVYSPLVYPNPTSSQLQVVNDRHSTIHIYQSDGQLVKTESCFQGTTAIDLSDLKNGLYLFRFDSRNGAQTVKVVKN